MATATKTSSKKAVKKVAVKKAPKAVSKKVTAGDPFYVVMRRGLFSSKVVSLHSAREDASNRATSLDNAANTVSNRHSVQRVDLVG